MAGAVFTRELLARSSKRPSREWVSLCSVVFLAELVLAIFVIFGSRMISQMNRRSFCAILMMVVPSTYRALWVSEIISGYTGSLLQWAPTRSRPYRSRFHCQRFGIFGQSPRGRPESPLQCSFGIVTQISVSLYYQFWLNTLLRNGHLRGVTSVSMRLMKRLVWSALTVSTGATRYCQTQVVPPKAGMHLRWVFPDFFFPSVFPFPAFRLS